MGMRSIQATMACVAAATTLTAGATNDNRYIEEVRIIGKASDAAAVAGSAYVIEGTELRRFEFTDINRILRQAPGVYAQEEEGFGLRPNIRIRGAGGDRNQKITVMEDGVLVAPAPYADPGAYYFPTAARIAGIEVLKGPQTLRYGPYTVGGAINLVSTAIPAGMSGFLNAEFAQRGEYRQHLWYGGEQGQWGFLLEVHNHQADGFHDIDRSSSDTGLDKQDYMGKLRWRSAADAAIAQQLELKLNLAEEISDSSYLGVTDAQFDRDPYRRYGLTEFDRMDNEQRGVVLRHELDVSDALSVNTQVYRNEFERSWYKVDTVGGVSLANVIASANAGNAAQLGWLEGTVDVANVRVKDNAREYYGEGLQVEFTGRLDTGRVSHEWASGVRWHRDESDRFQPNHVFNQVAGALVPVRVILPTGTDNRIEKADAFSFWLVDEIAVVNWTINPALRHENIETQARNYTDVGRTVVAATLGNDASEWLAGLGVTYDFDDRWQAIAGVHQGFAPANAGQRDGTRPEESVNYEFGGRYRGDRLGVDLIGFYSDYRNTVRNCTVANPCGASTVGSQSLGESEVSGFELAVNATLWEGGGLSVPVQVAYTYTDGQITEDAETGDVLDGDVLQYIPEHLLNITLALEHVDGWNVSASVSHVGEMCVDFQCDRPGVDPRYRETDPLWNVDLSATYPLPYNTELYARVDNLLDDESIVSRSPAGARVNKPRTAYIGVRWAF